MIISKSNITLNGTITLNIGAVLSGSIDNILNSDFSKTVSFTTGTFDFTINKAGTIDYVGMHGLSLPSNSRIYLTGTGISEEYTIPWDCKNLVFYFPTPKVIDDLTIRVVGSGTKVISYIQAGLASKIEWGVNSGQSLYYLGKNKKEKVSISSRGTPMARITEEVSPKLRISIKNTPKEWFRTDFREILEHYDTGGILSILDYEEENMPCESVAGFDLSATAPTAHSQTRSLLNVSLNLRVSA